MTTIDRTAATEQEFRDRIAAFESAPTPPEVREAAVIEEVARAMRATGEAVVAHNHVSFDIKAVGECPACDLYGRVNWLYPSARPAAAVSAEGRQGGLVGSGGPGLVALHPGETYWTLEQVRAALAPQAGEAGQ